MMRSFVECCNFVKLRLRQILPALTETDGFDIEYIKLRLVRHTHVCFALEAIALDCGTSSI